MWAGYRPTGHLRRPPGPKSDDQEDIPGLLLAALPGALPAQPALPRAQSGPGHDGRRHEGGVCNPGTRSGARPLAAAHREAAQAVPHRRTGMEAARSDVLAFLHFPEEHWRKDWSSRRSGSWSAAASSALFVGQALDKVPLNRSKPLQGHVAYTLNRNSITSPSSTTYSLPSARSQPLLRASAREPASSNCL